MIRGLVAGGGRSGHGASGVTSRPTIAATAAGVRCGQRLRQDHQRIDTTRDDQPVVVLCPVPPHEKTTNNGAPVPRRADD